MTHGITLILLTLPVFLWCLTGTALLNHLPLLSDPRLYARLRRGVPVNPLLITVILVVFWPARRLICKWLTQRSC